jgi:hypothetical protein
VRAEEDGASSIRILVDLDPRVDEMRAQAALRQLHADSDEAARLKRDDCAQGFLDDAAPL